MSDQEQQKWNAIYGACVATMIVDALPLCAQERDAELILTLPNEAQQQFANFARQVADAFCRR